MALSTTQKDSTSDKPGIAASPLFPAIVALWFAALLGLGALLLPEVLLARGLGAIGQDGTLPVSMAARMAVALGGAVLGALLGVVLARRVAAASATSRERKRADLRRAKEESRIELSTPRPISAREELGSDSLDAPVERDTPADELGWADETREYEAPEGAVGMFARPGGDGALAKDEVEPEPEPEPEPIAEAARQPIAGRRRALTSDTDVEEFYDTAPLPGSDAEADGLSVPVNDFAHLGDADPYDLDTFADEDMDDDEDQDEPVDLIALGGHALADDAGPFAAPVAPQGTPKTPENLPSAEFASDAGPFAQPVAAKTDDIFAEPEPAAASPAPLAEPSAISPTPPDAEIPILHDPNASAPSHDLDRPLEELGLAALVERFTRSLRRHAEVEDPFIEHTGEALSETPVPQAIAHEQPAPAVEAPPAQDHSTDVAPERPAMLEPVALDDPDDHAEEGEEPDSFGLPVMDAAPAPVAAPFAAPAPEAPAAEAEADADETNHEDSYSSLLALRNSVASDSESVRIEDTSPAEKADIAPEPVVVFPGQAANRAQAPAPFAAPPAPREPASIGDVRPFDAPAGIQHRRAQPGNTDAQLREALEKLRRMSGTA